MLSNVHLHRSRLLKCPMKPSGAHFRSSLAGTVRATRTDTRQVPLFPGVEQSIDIKIYYALEAAVLIGGLGVVDAAYSGDWSRIGVISKETELILQQAVQIIVPIHAVEGLIAAAIARGKGTNLFVAWIKGFAFGALGIWEIYTSDDEAK